VLAYFQGLFAFLALLVMSMMGFCYNINLVPRQMSGIVYRRIRDIPGSKTLLIAMAWGTVTAVLPALGVSASLNWSTVVVFLWSTGMVFVRTAFFDILDMQGDRIMGKETIPILLGEKRSMRLLKGMLMLLTVVMVLAALGGAVRPLGFLPALCPLVILALLAAYDRGEMLPGMRLEFMMESQFVLVGVLVLAGSLLS
jgi:4-hydroxy-3-methylbut-2-enyl diphosphate reductase